MWKNIVLLFFVASFTAVSSQNLTVECTFRLNVFNEYYCLLQNIEVLNPAANVTFGGVHIDGRTNNDVDIIVILDSMTPFMIPEMFTTFPNVNELTIENCSLQSIDIPGTVELFWLDIYGNNISRISSGSIRNQSSLIYVGFDENRIEEIDEDAFAEMGPSLFLFSLYNNNLTELAPRTFHSLSNVIYLDLDGNSLTSIGQELFSQTTSLNFLFMENNQINEVAPGFLDNLRGVLSSISLFGNVCIDRFFILGTESAWMDMNNALWTCFNNFSNGTTDGTRRLAMQFQGNLRFFDEFGNMVVSI